MDKLNCTRKYWIIIPSFIIIVITVTILTIALLWKNNNVIDDRPKLIIDHDGGADDAMAIFMALLYEKHFNGPVVLALTTGHGNVHEDQTFINSQRILDIADRREVPIYRGSNISLVISVPSEDFFGADGLGDNEHRPIRAIEAQPQHAALGIIQLANQYPGKISVVALGALTNLALAMRLEPTLLSRLAHVYVAAGSVYSEIEPNAEFNAEQDTESYHVVIQSANPEQVTIVPFSQVGTQNVTRQWREQVLGAIPTKIMKAQNSFERISINHSEAWSLLDPIAMGVALNDTIVGDILYSQNDIILCGDKRGVNTNNFTTKEQANVEVVNKIIENEYKNLLVTIFSAELYNK